MRFRQFNQLLHHVLEFFGMRLRQVGGLKGILGQVEQLIVRVIRLLRRMVVIDDLPIVVSQHGEVIAAVRPVRIMHQELLVPRLIGLARDQRLQSLTINNVSLRRRHSVQS